jgi:predicted ArsR family transcriptional regulator
MKANLDSKILAVLEDNPKGLSTLQVSRLCQINRRTARNHLDALVRRGKVVQQIIHSRMFLFSLADKDLN